MDEDGSIKTLTPELRARVRQYISKMASQGLRTLTLAMKDLGDRDGIAGTLKDLGDRDGIAGVLALLVPKYKY
jgi:hypothetical protein